jgi:diaminopimelate epimerase
VSNRIAPLAELNERWRTSVLVEIGNPHCVTLVAPSQVPTFDELSDERLHRALRAIAFAPGGHDRAPRYFPRGINLQWAGTEQPGTRDETPAIVRAAVFERGEGATLSSGSSAVAVASAAWHVGLIASTEVLVDMPGGRVPIQLELTDEGTIARAFLFGVATEIGSTQTSAT